MNKESIISAFNSKGTLLKWLKHVDKRLDDIEAMRPTKLHKISITAPAGGDYESGTDVNVTFSLFLSQDQLNIGKYIDILGKGHVLGDAYITYPLYSTEEIVKCTVEMYSGDKVTVKLLHISPSSDAEVISEAFGYITYVNGNPMFELAEGADVEIEVMEI